MILKSTMKLFFILFFLNPIELTKHRLVCHSHDDLGWLKTIDQYYENSVRQILTSAISALEKTKTSDPRLIRKFVYSEVGFLKIFINEDKKQSRQKIEKIKNLIKNGQWEWVNGGISQSDSACPHYEDIISNYFAGQSYLKRNFDSSSKIGWQLDPFGHSKALMFIARKFGMEHAVIARIPLKDKLKLDESKNLEFKWQFHDNSLITIHFYNHYNSPKSLKCDVDCDFASFDQRLFKEECSQNDNLYKGENVFLIGDDFEFKKSESRFDFLDQVLSMQENKEVQYSTYSEYIKMFDDDTEKEPFLYFQDDLFVYQESSLGLGHHSEDTRTNGGDIWSGYFTTKPNLKHAVRRIGKLLRTFKLVFGYKFFHQNQINHKAESDIFHDLSEDAGIFLHHDCITGTSMEEVDKDYFKRIRQLELQINTIIDVTESISTKDSKNESLGGYSCDFNEVISSNGQPVKFFSNILKMNSVWFKVYNGLGIYHTRLYRIVLPDLKNKAIVKILNSEKVPIESFFHCSKIFNLCEIFFKIDPKLNVDFEISQLFVLHVSPIEKVENVKNHMNDKTIIDVSEDDDRHADNLFDNEKTSILNKSQKLSTSTFDIFNGMYNPVVSIINAEKLITNEFGEGSSYHYNSKDGQSDKKKTSFKLNKIWKNPPVAKSIDIEIDEIDNINKKQPDVNQEENVLSQKVEIEDPENEITFDFEKFSIFVSKSKIRYASKTDFDFENVISYSFFNSGLSGHYILKYTDRVMYKYNEFISAEQINNSLFQGVYIKGTKVDLYLRQEINKDFYIIESLVKYNKDLSEGIDVILNIESNKISNDQRTFFTDSNGLFKIEREFKGKHESNVFPVTSFAEVLDADERAGLLVFNDRAQGAFCIGPGVSFYIQRSAKYQDNKGNPENLRVHYDVNVLHTIYNFKGDNPNDDVVVELKNLNDLEPLVIFKESDEGSKSRSDKVRLPKNLKIPSSLRINLELVDETKILLRIQNISDNKEIYCDLENITFQLFGESDKKKIDFEYVFGDPLNSTAIEKTYKILPLEFMTFLIDKKKKSLI